LFDVNHWSVVRQHENSIFAAFRSGGDHLTFERSSVSCHQILRHIPELTQLVDWIELPKRPRLLKCLPIAFGDHLHRVILYCTKRRKMISNQCNLRPPSNNVCVSSFFSCRKGRTRFAKRTLGSDVRVVTDRCNESEIRPINRLTVA
jgi:hypothetical protein